jgi:hypothetical protein
VRRREIFAQREKSQRARAPGDPLRERERSQTVHERAVNAKTAKHLLRGRGRNVAQPRDLVRYGRPIEI